MTKLTEPPRDRVRLGIPLALASIFCFSATSLLLSFANTAYGMDGWVAAAYRGAFGLVAVFMLQSRLGRPHFCHIFTNRLLFLRGLLGGIAIPIFYISIMELGAGRAGIITGSYPLFAAVVAMLLIKERLQWTYLVYITIAILGLLGIFSDQGIGEAKLFYDIVAMMGASAAGLGVVLIRHLRHTENTSSIFASQCVFTLTFGLSVAGTDVLIEDPRALGLTVLAAITVIGGQLCITESFRHITVAKGSTLQMLTPVTTCVLSALLLGEHFSGLELLGGGAILFASYQIVRLKPR